MARAALTIGGALVGAVFGVPQLGALAGGVLGAVLFPGPPQKGPRLEDTMVAPGTYGSPIAIAYGEGVINADLIWVEGGALKEKRKKSSAGGKGGPTYITYEYYATFAVLICDNPITGVRRIWFGDELVYDATSEALSAAISAGTALPLTGPIEGLTVRVYTGSASQDADPRIEAEDTNAPAWRGMSYLVFEDVPLERWGNRIPPVLVEVTAAPATWPTLFLPDYTNGRDSVSFDPARGRLFVTKARKLAVEIYDMVSGRLERVDDISGAPNVWTESSVPQGGVPSEISEASGYQWFNDYTPPAPAPDGSFYVITETWNGSVSFGGAPVVDAESGQWIATLATKANLTSNKYGLTTAGTEVSTVQSHAVREVDWLPVDPVTGVRPYLYHRLTRGGWGFFGAVSIASRGAVDAPGAIDWGVGIYNGTGQMDVDASGTYAYLYYKDSSGTHGLKRAPIGAPPVGSQNYDADAYTPDLSVTLDGALGDPTAVWVDRDAGTLVLVGTSGVGIYDANLLKIRELTFTNARLGGWRGITGHVDGRVWFVSADDPDGDTTEALRAIDTASGQIVARIPLANWGYSWGTLPNVATWDPVFRLRGDSWAASDVPVGSNDRALVLFGSRFGGQRVALADVLRDAARRAGVADSEVDLSAVTRQIWGAPQKSARLTARGLWEDLLALTDHEAALLDGKLTVRPRATAASASLGDDDLGADGGPALTRRTVASDSPRRVEIVYRSRPAQHEPAEQADEFPVEVVPSGEVARISTSLVMDDDEAWGAAQRLLAAASAERVEMELATPYTRADIETGAIVTVSGDGGSHQMRVREIAGDRVLRMRGHLAAPLLATAGTPLDTTRPAPVLDEISPTDFALVDSHLWRDEDDGSAFHVAVWPRRATWKWSGGIIWRSADGTTFDDEWAALTDAVTVGQATAKLGDVSSANFWDRANSLTVRMISGTPASATEAQVLAGANPVWVACGTTGEWELVQFASAVENADGTWTLSTLLRGRRGTEHLTGSHASGDRVIWADAKSVLRLGGSSIGTQYHYVAGSVGLVAQDWTTRRGFTNRARSLRPWSPVRLRGSRNGSGDLTVTWVRRSRIVGDVNNTACPLGEESESYELDVLDGSGAVVRTITGLTSPSATYTAAEQTSDFGSAQSSIRVKVYQISATVGRGVAAEATL